MEEQFDDCAMLTTVLSITVHNTTVKNISVPNLMYTSYRYASRNVILSNAKKCDYGTDLSGTEVYKYDLINTAFELFTCGMTIGTKAGVPTG